MSKRGLSQVINFGLLQLIHIQIVNVACRCNYIFINQVALAKSEQKELVVFESTTCPQAEICQTGRVKHRPKFVRFIRAGWLFFV